MGKLNFMAKFRKVGKSKKAQRKAAHKPAVLAAKRQMGAIGHLSTAGRERRAGRKTNARTAIGRARSINKDRGNFLP